MKRVVVTGKNSYVANSFIENYGANYAIQKICLKTQNPDQIDFTGVDTVIHCAALVHQTERIQESEYFKVNYSLTKALAEQAKKAGVSHFIFLSTVKVYGSDGSLAEHDQLFSENSPCHPSDPYGASKLQAEEALRQMETADFKVAVVRSPVIYGKNSKGNLLLLSKLAKVCPFLPFNYTHNHRSLVYISNLTFYLQRILEKKSSGIFIPQDAKPLSIREIVSLMCEIFHKKALLFRLPPVLFHWLCRVRPHLMVRIYGSLCFDSTQTNLLLEAKPPYSSQEGFQNMLGSGGSHV